MSPDTDRTPTHNQSSMDATATVGDPLRGRVRTTLADASRALRTRNSSKKADSASRAAPGQSHRGGERRTVTSSSQPDASSGYQSTASEVSTQPPPSVRSTDSAIRSQSTATNIINPMRLNPVSLPTYASSCSDWQGNPGPLRRAARLATRESNRSHAGLSHWNLHDVGVPLIGGSADDPSRSAPRRSISDMLQRFWPFSRSKKATSDSVSARQSTSGLIKPAGDSETHRKERDARIQAWQDGLSAPACRTHPGVTDMTAESRGRAE